MSRTAFERAGDSLWRAMLAVGHRVLLVYWKTFRPKRHGAATLVIHRGRLLLVRHSYKPGYGVPAGAVKRGEHSRETAVRELEEEVGIRADAAGLREVGDVRSRHEGKRDRTAFFRLDLEAPPALEIDRREIVWAGFHELERLDELQLWLPLELALERYGERIVTPVAGRAP